MTVRIGVYVDAANIVMNGGRDMRYDVLRDYAARSGSVVQRLNTYLPIDHERRAQDADYQFKQDLFMRRIRDFGWRVHQKPVMRYRQEDGEIAIKANADMELAIDALIESDRLDRVVLVTGDGDFCRLVQALQAKGCRVEAIGFRHVSRELRNVVDEYVSGYLVPELVPTREPMVHWGTEGAIVRGVLEHWNEEKRIGVVRFLTELDSGIWETDPRRNNTPYRRAFIAASSFLQPVRCLELFRRESVLEFRIIKNKLDEPPFMAQECTVIDS